MMPAKYIAIDGSTKSFDLDVVVDCVEGDSPKRKGWTGLVVYDSAHDVFIELRDSPPDVRGNSISECEEISSAEIAANYGISETACMQIRKNPHSWNLIDQRKDA